MMFLEFFIWGGWFVTLGTFLANNLNANDPQKAMAFSTQSWGAIMAPFIIGLIADRFFNAERILGILHLLGAGLMYLMATSSDFSGFYPLVLGYMILYMPTLALVNSVAFNQMKDTAKEFGYIRVWETIGWIIAGITISFLNWDAPQAIAGGALQNTFFMAGGASATLGLMSFTLPKTQPKVKIGEKVTLGDVLGYEALGLLKDRNFLIFFISSVLICIPLAFYYQYTNSFLVEVSMQNATGKMALGQGSEVVFMLLLPIFLKRFGIKATLLVGMAAWVLRYLLFAFGDAGPGAYMLITGIFLHGICYDFFFVSGQIFTDHKAGEKVRSAAQGMITLATYGVGMLIGFWVAGQIAELYFMPDGTYNWSRIWIFPAVFAAVVFVLFGLLFKNEKIELQGAEVGASSVGEITLSTT